MKKRKIIDFCILVVAVMLVSFSTVFAADNLKTEASDGAYWKVVKYDDVTQYRNNPEVVEGYLFAGWFSDKSCAKDTALKASDTEGAAYAKYVPEEILGLKAQVNGELYDKDTTNDEQGAIRFVTSVDSLDYREIGFKITVGASTKENRKSSRTVYKQLYVNVGESNPEGDKTKVEEFNPGQIFHTSSQYFKTWTVTSMKNVNYRTEFKVTPFWVTLDGTEVTGTQGIKTVNGGRTWEYVFVDDSGNDGTGAGTRECPYQSLDMALSEMQANKKYQSANSVGTAKVDMIGKVYIINSLTATESFAWSDHNLDVAISGKAPNATETANVDFSALAKLNMGDAATFENMNLKFPTTTIYANGHRLEIAESVTADTANKPKVFGGSGTRKVESTHVTLLSGNYANIYAGGEKQNVTGDTYIYIGGTVNNDVLENTEASLHNKNTGKDSLHVFGGSYQATVSGDTHVTVGGSALINYVRGGGSGASQTVTGTCYVNLEDNAGVYGINGGGSNGSVNNTYVVVRGGTVYQLQGGMTSAGGTVNNTSVQILGGTVKRRVYGGNYNEDDGSLLATGWADTDYHVNGYSTVTIGNEANLLLNTDVDNSLCAVSRNGRNVEPEIGIMILNSSKSEQKVGFANMASLPVTNVLPTHFLVKVAQGGTAVSEGSVLRITPDSPKAYATVKKGEEVLFQCQGEGTCPFSLFGEKTSEIQNITVTFSDSETLSGNYVLSYGDNSYSYFNTLSDAIAAVSTPEISVGGVMTQKTATITIGEEACTVDSTIVVADGDNIVLQNKEGVAVTIKRGTGLTGDGQFVFDIVKGGSLTIDGAIVVDGNGVTGPSMIDNKGEFTLGQNATLQNAKSIGNGAALFNRDGIANLYGNMKGNQAKQGGALANSGEATIHSGEYSNNTSTNEGGAIYSATTGNKLTIKGGSFYHNTAESKAGGVVHCTGTLTITGGEYYNNKAVTGGGAINIAHIDGSQPAMITGAVMYDNSLTGSTDAGGAICVAKNATLALGNCNIYNNNAAYKDNANPGADISLLENATLNLKNSTNVGVVQLRNATASINVQEAYTGKMVLVPYNNVYTIGLQVVAFAAGTEDSANNIIVRKYVSETKYYDDIYGVDAEGTLQYKNPEAQIGETIYPTFTEAIAAATTGDTVYVLKDIEVDGTIAVGSAEAPINLTIANVSGKDVKITRTGKVSMFDVAAGSTLTIGSADTTNKLIVDGGYVAEAETKLIGSSLVSNAGTFILEANATIQNAHTAGSNAATNLGGALNNAANAVATIKGTIRGCSAFNGGAIYNETNGTTIIEEGATFAENIANGGNGGAIRNKGALTITGATFTGNKGEGSNGNGGAIFNTGASEITDTAFARNSGRSGGAIYNQDANGKITIKGGSFTGNSAMIGSGTGGAIYVRDTSGEVTIADAEFTQNSSITNNSAAIDAQKNVTLTNCNIHDNVSSSSKNAVYDIRIGDAILSLAGNTKAGVVYQGNANGRVNIGSDFTGNIILVPNDYTAGTQVVTFADDVVDKEAIVSRIVVRKVLSQDSFDDMTYYVDEAGTVQELNGVAKVGNTYYGTLAEAIAAISGGETVYVLKNIELSEAITIPAELNVTITNMSGRDITLTRTGNQAMFTVEGTLTIGSADKANTITLDGGYAAEAETPLTGKPLVGNAGTFTLEANATIQNANTGGGTAAADLGGALNNKANAAANIKGTIRGCSAYNGGAIYNVASGTVIIEEGAVLAENRAIGGNGGAIRNLGTLSITKATFMGNKGEGNTQYLNGGAIYNTGTLKANSVTFKGNTGRSGGAIYHDTKTGDLVIKGGSFIENSAAISANGATGTGGAINITSNSGAGSVSITGAEFTKNSSVTNNSAAINAQKAITLTDCNIHDNVAFAGSTNAVYDIQLGNAILSLDGNTKTGVLHQDNAGGKVNVLKDFTGDITLVPNAYTAGAQVVTFADGVTDKGSIASKIVVGKVISGQVVDNGKYYIDVDGNLQALTEAAKVGDTRYATLAEALASVTTEEPTTIYLMNHADLNGVLAVGTADAKRNITIMNLAGEDVTLTRAEADSMINVAAGSSLTIACSEGGKITLDGNNSLKTPHLIKNEGTFVLETGAVIQNAVTGGSKNDEPYNGAALYNVGTATLRGTFTGCSAYNGGAVFNDQNATMEVIGATFTENTANGGNGGAIRNKGILTVTGVTFKGNKTAENQTKRNGGAIHSDNSLEVKDSVFENNYAYATGGAIYASSCKISNCDFNNNTAGHGTGGAVRGSGEFIISGGTYAGNKAATNGGAVDASGTGTVVIQDVTMHDNSLTAVEHGGGAIYVPSGKNLNLTNSNIYNNASYTAKDGVQACDIYNGGNLTLSGVTANDNNAETTEQCLVYQSGKLYYVDENGELKEHI